MSGMKNLFMWRKTGDPGLDDKDSIIKRFWVHLDMPGFGPFSTWQDYLQDKHEDGKPAILLGVIGEKNRPNKVVDMIKSCNFQKDEWCKVFVGKEKCDLFCDEDGCDVFVLYIDGVPASEVVNQFKDYEQSKEHKLHEGRLFKYDIVMMGFPTTAMFNKATSAEMLYGMEEVAI